MKMIIHIQKKQGQLFMGTTEHIVYMLKCKDHTLYTGYTNDLQHRLALHESGKGAKYTRGRGPFEVVYQEKFQTKGEALKREYAIKQLTKQEKEKLIQAYQKEVNLGVHTKEL